MDNARASALLAWSRDEADQAFDGNRDAVICSQLNGWQSDRDRFIASRGARREIAVKGSRQFSARGATFHLETSSSQECNNCELQENYKRCLSQAQPNGLDGGRTQKEGCLP